MAAQRRKESEGKLTSGGIIYVDATGRVLGQLVRRRHIRRGLVISVVLWVGVIFAWAYVLNYEAVTIRNVPPVPAPSPALNATEANATSGAGILQPMGMDVSISSTVVYRWILWPVFPDCNLNGADFNQTYCALLRTIVPVVPMYIDGLGTLWAYHILALTCDTIVAVMAFGLTAFDTKMVPIQGRVQYRS